MQDYRNLKVWEKAHRLVLDVYAATGGFPKNELYGITSQLRRAIVSISTNIVEGCGRKTKPDFARFLTISVASANESEYLLLLARDLSYLTDQQFTSLTAQLIEVRKMMLGLINTLHPKADA